MVGTIYKITNNINQKIYVGQTIQKVKRRWKDHCCAKNNTLIHKAIVKYGKENFTFEVLESNVLLENLSTREAYYIQLFNSNNLKVGYNRGEVINGVIQHDKESINKMSLRMKERFTNNPEMREMARKNGLKRRGQKIGGKSKYVGVSLDRGKWRATSSLNGKQITIGRFSTEEEAADAYKKFALEHF